MRLLTIFFTFCVTAAFSQKVFHVKAGEYADKVMVGKSSGMFVQELLRKGSGSVCYKDKAPPKMSKQTCASHIEEGFSIVIAWTDDSTLTEKQRNEIFLNAKVSSVIIEEPAIAIDEKKQVLLGKKEAEIKKLYSGKFEETYNRSSDQKYIIYFSQGIAFTIDLKIDKCIEVEIFTGSKSFIYNFNQRLSQF